MHKLQLSLTQRIYLASDFHLGWPNPMESQARERKIIQWLEQSAEDAALIILLGDIFDFWFEHKRVIPKGAVRLQGKLAELTDKGIPIVLFTGNHDLWMKEYLCQELGVSIYHEPQSVQWNDKKLYLGHGDGLGPHDRKYKFLKRYLFQNTVCMYIFEHFLHPNWALGLAQAWSNASKRKNKVVFSPAEQDQRIEKAQQNPEKEWLWHYAKQLEEQNPHDYYVFGHRHLPLNFPIGQTSRYINLGEWLNFDTYAVFDGTALSLKRFACVSSD